MTVPTIETSNLAIQSTVRATQPAANVCVSLTTWGSDVQSSLIRFHRISNNERFSVRSDTEALLLVGRCFDINCLKGDAVKG